MVSETRSSSSGALSRANATHSSVKKSNAKSVDSHLPGHVRVLINSRTHVRRGSPVSASRVVSHLVRVVVENAQRLASKSSASVEFSPRGVCSVGIAGVFRRWVIDAYYSPFVLLLVYAFTRRSDRRARVTWRRKVTRMRFSVSETRNDERQTPTNDRRTSRARVARLRRLNETNFYESIGVSWRASRRRASSSTHEKDCLSRLATRPASSSSLRRSRRRRPDDVDADASEPDVVSVRPRRDDARDVASRRARVRWKDDDGRYR